MATEIQVLSWSVVWAFLQIMLTTAASVPQLGIKWKMSGRDQAKPPLTGVAARMQRATENFKETYPLFIAAVVVNQLLGKNNSTTLLGAHLYLWSRVLYVPIYALDVPYVRTIAWGVSILGIFLVLCAT